MDELNSIMTGGDAFITKPYNIAILLAKIASLLNRAFPDPKRKNVSRDFPGRERCSIRRAAGWNMTERARN